MPNKSFCKVKNHIDNPKPFFVKIMCSIRTIPNSVTLEDVKNNGTTSRLFLITCIVYRCKGNIYVVPVPSSPLQQDIKYGNRT